MDPQTLAVIHTRAGPLGIDLKVGPLERIDFDAQKAFVTVDLFQPPSLSAGGGTPMGGAVRRALELLRERELGLTMWRVFPFRNALFLMTAGALVVGAEEHGDSGERAGAVDTGPDDDLGFIELLQLREEGSCLLPGASKAGFDIEAAIKLLTKSGPVNLPQ